MAVVDQGSAEESGEPKTNCSFCGKSEDEVGTLVEGIEMESGNAFICRNCAELALAVFDQIDQRQRGEGPTTMEMLEYLKGALDRLMALSKERELTASELERKQEVEADLETLRSLS
jgi:superfamily II helicase